MTTKPVKPLKTGNERIEVELWVMPVKQFEPNFPIDATVIAELEADDFDTFQEAVKEKLDEIKKSKKEQSQFSLINEVWNVLGNPEPEYEKSGKPKRNQQGTVEAVYHDMKVKKRIYRILDEVEKILDKQGTQSYKHKTAKITLKPSDAEYLAKRMQSHFEHDLREAPFVIKGYDYFAELEAEAKKAE